MLDMICQQATEYDNSVHTVKRPIPFSFVQMVKASESVTGRRLKAAVVKSGLSISAFARKAQLSRQNLYNLFENPDTAEPSTVIKIAKALGVDISHLPAEDSQGLRLRVLSLIAESNAQHAEQRQVPRGRLTGVSRDTFDSPAWDLNIEPYSEQPVTAVPSFELAVAAGPWTEIVDYAELTAQREIDHGFFRVKIRGESMTPTYRDGVLVEFRCLRQGRDIMQVGRDYYVQRGDGMATFKRLWKVEETHIVLRAINRKKYAEDIHVDRAEIVRMALAIAKVELVY